MPGLTSPEKRKRRGAGDSESDEDAASLGSDASGREPSAPPPPPSGGSATSMGSGLQTSTPGRGNRRGRPRTHPDNPTFAVQQTWPGYAYPGPIFMQQPYQPQYYGFSQEAMMRGNAPQWFMPGPPQENMQGHMQQLQGGQARMAVFNSAFEPMGNWPSTQPAPTIRRRRAQTIPSKQRQYQEPSIAADRPRRGSGKLRKRQDPGLPTKRRRLTHPLPPWEPIPSSSPFAQYDPRFTYRPPGSYKSWMATEPPPLAGWGYLITHKGNEANNPASASTAPDEMDDYSTPENTCGIDDFSARIGARLAAWASAPDPASAPAPAQYNFAHIPPQDEPGPQIVPRAASATPRGASPGYARPPAPPWSGTPLADVVPDPGTEHAMASTLAAMRVSDGQGAAGWQAVKDGAGGGGGRDRKGKGKARS